MSLVVRRSRLLRYNAGAFVSAGEACLIDPGVLAEEVAGLVAELHDAAIVSIVLTHADWDHVLGPEHLPPATIVAHEDFARSLDPDGIRAALGQLEDHAGIVRERSFEPPLPDTTFAAAMTLRVGELELHLAHAPGHTADMLTVYEPESATLWAADVLSDVEIPLVVHDLAAYEATLARLAELEIATLVPGHGFPTSDRSGVARRLDEDRRYLAELRATVSEAVQSGYGLDETVAAAARVALRRSPEDEAVHRLNVEKVYADLGGDADPEQVGFARAWKEATRA
ncbi:MAG TPA: MBL fold metallo-hydrolase [Gaiellaceae bacterium]|nr:MBL fold metallo-hydrolase [Gaiellaceae bacterium]